MGKGKTKEDKKREAKVKSEKAKGHGFKLSIRMLILILVVVPLVASIVIISVISSMNTKKTLEEEAESRLYVVANNLANYCSGNNVNAGNAQTYYDFLDGLKERNMEMAIVFENGSCASSVKNENDYRVREIPFNKDFEEDAEELLKGYFDESVVIEGKEYFGYYMPVITDGKIVAMAFGGELKANVTKAVEESIQSSVIIAVILSVIFIVVAVVSSTGIIKAVKVVGKRVTALSEGDLSQQPKKKSGIKEMHLLLDETKGMQESLGETIGKVKLVAFKLAGNIAEVTGLSNSSAGRANQISEAMEHFSSVAGGMAENVQDINERMMEVGSCVTDISEAVEYLERNSAVLLQSNTEAKGDMNVIMNNSQKSVKAVNEILEQIRETNESIMEIEKAVSVILNIAEQTELLSLNASIEAARAGEHGKGFAVVAGEIGSLSAQSADGAEMIKNLAQTIIEKSQMSVELADGIASLMMQEQQSIANTQRTYEELSENINLSVSRIKDIADKTDNLNASKERVLDNVQDLSAISEENYASCEEVTATVNEIVSEVQMVSMNCDRMNQMAQELEVSASYFHE